MNLLASLVKGGYKVAMFNRELPNSEVIKKLICIENPRLNYRDVRKGIVDKTNTNFISQLKKASQKIAEKNILKKFTKRFPNLSPGDALIHHCLTVHGSGRNNSNISRRGVTLQFRAKNSIIDKMLKKNYEKQLKYQLKSR